ncbi:MAG TPA: hypothetical protein VHO27_00675 [Angustibacter sp.]|nr:hypothetical protein [Angustibacter sp.]
MDALDVVRVCVRRWYVSLPLVAIAVLAGFKVTEGGKPTYGATGSFALIYTHTAELKPNQQDPRMANPLVAGGGVELLKESLIADLTSTETQTALQQQGASGAPPSSVTVGQNVRLGSAFSVDAPRASQSIVVSAYGPDAAAVRAAVLGALKAAPTRLAAIQDRFNVPAKGQYTSFVTAAPQLVSFPPPSRAKALIAIGGVGVIAGAALSLIVDRLLTRRRQRRAVRELEEAVDDPDRRSRAPKSLAR